MKGLKMGLKVALLKKDNLKLKAGKWSFLCIYIYCFFLPLFVVGQICDNRCLDFDGIDDFVQATSPLTGDVDFTFEAWFRSDSSLVGSCDPNLSNFRWLVSWDDNLFGIGDCAGDLRIVFQPICPVGGNGLCTSLPVVSINDENWHHIAFIRGISTTGSRVLVDGNYLTNFSASAYDFSGFFRLGLGGTGTVGNPWEGKMDEVRIWDSALADTVIQSRLNCSLTGTETGLLLYYDFEHGTPGGNNLSDTILVDKTISSNDGNLSNFTLNGNNSNWLCSDSAEYLILKPDTSLVIDSIGQIQYVYECLGDSVELCNMEYILSGNQYQWFNASGDSLSSLLMDSCFVLDTLTVSNSGAYYCHITNASHPDTTYVVAPIIVQPFFMPCVSYK